MPAPPRGHDDASGGLIGFRCAVAKPGAQLREAAQFGELGQHEVGFPGAESSFGLIRRRECRDESGPIERPVAGSDIGAQVGLAQHRGKLAVQTKIVAQMSVGILAQRFTRPLDEALGARRQRLFG